MAITWTRTRTNVYIIGEGLLEKHPELTELRQKMIEVGENLEHKQSLDELGIRLVETNDAAELELMHYQWNDILGKRLDLDPALLKDLGLLLSISRELEEGDGDSQRRK